MLYLESLSQMPYMLLEQSKINKIRVRGGAACAATMGLGVVRVCAETAAAGNAKQPMKSRRRTINARVSEAHLTTAR
jgi:hypothetical protein